MSSIYQRGSYVLPLKSSSSLLGATVEVVFKNGSRRFVKQAEVIDFSSGKCEVELTPTDLEGAGEYLFQPTIKVDGKDHPATIHTFNVLARL